jgi:hypothetical protein
MYPLKKILWKFVKSHGIEGGDALLTIRTRWKSIVGRTIALHTSPDTIRRKVLTIIVDTPQWMHHLSFYKGEIMDKLRSHEVSEVRFRVGKLPGKSRTSFYRENINLTDEDTQYVENTVKHIKDEELRQKFRKLITHGLTKRKNKDKLKTDY